MDGSRILGDENHPYWCRQLPHDLNELNRGYGTDRDLKMTDDERKRQYEICKERGHVPSDIQLTSLPPQEVCAKCGTHYRYDRVLVEFDAPNGENYDLRIYLSILQERQASRL
jgi:hypothetical protein